MPFSSECRWNCFGVLASANLARSDVVGLYVGTLKAIDSDTATVSLQDVQCHGTEGRKGNPAEEMAGSDTLYDGIVFRGSDVKDLTIIAPPKENRPPQQIPNDPAILGSSSSPAQQQQPPQQQNQFRGPPPPYPPQQQFGYPGQPPNQFQQPPRFQGPGGAHGFPGQPGAVPGYGMGFGPPPPGYGPMGMGYGPPPPGAPGFQGPPPGHFPPNQQPIGPPGQMNHQRPPQQMPPQQQAPIGSKQNTPQPESNQAPPPTNPAEMSGTPIPPSTSTAGPPPPVESKPPPSAATAPAAAPQAQQQPAPKPVQKANPRVAVPLASPAAVKQQPKPAPQAPAAAAAASSTQAPLPSVNPDAATAAVAAAMASLGVQNQQAAGVDNLTQKVNQMRVQDHQTRGRGRGRGGAPRGGRRESAQKGIEVPKEDFDFETSNAKFNKQELVKEAIASGSPITSPANGDIPDPLSATNGHAADVEDVVIPPKPADKGYDKKSSFFDNISSDLKDRTEQQQAHTMVDGRAMRREERTRNMETFGQGSVDGGGYRGRGRGRGRGFEFEKYLQRWSDLDLKQPAAILLPRTEDECQKAVRWAVSNNIPFTAKSGGHSLYSTIGEKGVVIDLSDYAGIKHDNESKTAVLWGGVNTKTVAVQLAKDGCCTTLPAVNAVGAIPFFLNGGLSKNVAQLGYGSDLIVSARVITADGKLIDVDEDHHADLLYAIRGAGQYFGLVTQLTIRTFTFEEALDNTQGVVWDGRFIFPIDRAQEICEVMKDIVSNDAYAMNGLIMVGAPPPARKPCIAVLPRLISKDPSTLQQEAFKPLYDLNPLVTGGSEIPIQNAADALDPLGACGGGYKKLVLTGLYSLESSLFTDVTKIWQDLTTSHPDALSTTFSFQWDSRPPKHAPFESANSMHDVRFWANNMTWCTDPGSVEAVEKALEKVIGTLRTGQREEEFVDFANSLRTGPVGRRHRGEERVGKLRELKRVWDGEGVFGREFL
ncbi:hypothetical protein M409DRAFT_28261 [Zasmidium cellare ATCC 36951]|uniref:FAD-binding PCMH-type domain-containing protein n=1 Tax=Zasmidium cellare ATCC 36951 TaxID=1080233 RepID=A0A6A6C5S1_ZASCE|nr:uncharacterized protein M409DRAFT_28261 [Zasmidium cellare ATCC 36951]KAF2161222.1 hypothetical protein M409DRAFT_28261 [Zasmidium cellare ATCC 36951]